MNDSKTPITENFNPLDYESIHQNLQAAAALLDGMAWRQSAGEHNEPMALALFKLADEVAVEAKRAEKFFNETHKFYKGVKHG